MNERTSTNGQTAHKRIRLSKRKNKLAKKELKKGKTNERTKGRRMERTN